MVKNVIVCFVVDVDVQLNDELEDVLFLNFL